MARRHPARRAGGRVKTRIVQRVDVATGADAQRALIDVLRERIIDGRGAYHVAVAHDDGCPCVTGRRPLSACNCEVVQLVVSERTTE